MFRNFTICLISLALLALATSNAVAQTPEGEQPDNETPVETTSPPTEVENPEEPSSAAITADAADPMAPGDATGDELPAQADDETLDPDDPLYWAKLRDVYTVQKRAFQKQGRLAVTVYGGLIPNNAFEKYIPIGLRINYFILENLGLELASSYAINIETGLESVIREPQGAGAQQILVGDTQLSHTNFGVVWSPFYGKTAFYNSALNYFDFYLFAGAGLVITETVPDFNEEPESDFKPEGALGAGLAYYLGDNAAVRIDFRQFVFQKVEGVGGVANPSEVSLGLGWFF